MSEKFSFIIFVVISPSDVGFKYLPSRATYPLEIITVIIGVYVLGLPIPEITQERMGASAVILSPIASQEAPRYRGEEEVCKETNTYLRIFGKPYTKMNRRMGVVVCYAPIGSDLDALRNKCKAAAAKVEVY